MGCVINTTLKADVLSPVPQEELNFAQCMSHCCVDWAGEKERPYLAIVAPTELHQ